MDRGTGENSRGPRPIARWRSLTLRALVASAGVLCAVGLATAQADLTSSTGTSTAAPQTTTVAVPSSPAPSASTPNTPYTPQPQSWSAASSPWTYVGGLQYSNGVPETAVPPNSATPANVNFYSVAFTRPGLGFAGGSICAASTDLTAQHTCANPQPVIWKYSKSAAGIGTWTVDATFPGAPAGFVGAIGFLPGTDTAVAVGGTGTYPYFEQPFGSPDPAGSALAWEYQDGAWHQVPTPTGMSGLTAIGFSPRPADCGGSTQECGFAGGFQQLWRWTNGHFASAPEAISINYRVRSIKFTPGASVASTPGSPPLLAFAVTSGCCAQQQTSQQTPVGNQPQLLAFTGNQWQAMDGPTNLGQADSQGLPDSYYGLYVETTSINNTPIVSLVLSPGEASGPTSGLTARIAGDIDPKQQSAGFDLIEGSGPNQAGGFSTNQTATELANPRVTDLGLAAGDGDALMSPGAQLLPGGRNQAPQPGQDGYMDWAVGEVRATGEAAAYTTTTDPHSGPAGEVPNPIDCSVSQTQARPTQCPPDPNNVQSQETSNAVFQLPTFGLNAYTISGTGGVGWAVGDRGAIMELGAGAGAVQVPSPDSSIGSPAPVPTGASASYAPYLPEATTQPGTVPPVDAQPLVAGAAPQLVPVGSADPDRLQNDIDRTVTSIAMSRDGSEGWGVGGYPLGNGSATAFFHYTGGQWRLCSPAPEGSEVADPACASLGHLFTYTDGASPSGVDILTVARVPTEYGGDATHANDFQAVAFGTSYAPASGNPGNGVMLRYADGRWTVDDASSRQLNLLANAGTVASIAYGSPTDGWIATSEPAIKHYDVASKSWITCAPQSQVTASLACDDPAGRLGAFSSTGHGGPWVTAVGQRLYAYGTQAINGVNYPLILYRDSGQSCSKPTDPGCWHSADGGLDAAAAGQASDPNQQGVISNLSVVRNADGSYSGWAVGSFGSQTSFEAVPGHAPVWALLHLVRAADGTYGWTPWTAPDASADYLLQPLQTQGQTGVTSGSVLDSVLVNERLVTLPGANGEGRAFLVQGTGDVSQSDFGPMLEYDPSQQRWRVFPTPFTLIPNSDTGAGASIGVPEAISADGVGGFWLAVRHQLSYAQDQFGYGRLRAVWFYHYTSQVRRPVFQDVPQPIRSPINAMAGGGDGSVWVATGSNTVYRYDRVTGWSEIHIAGWQSGTLSTAGAPAEAIAVGPDGRGVVVGQGGRIADLSPSQVLLDAAASVRCVTSACHGTTFDLDAAAVAPGGSTIVAGAGRTILWRERGGVFTSVSPAPPVSPATVFTGASYPAPNRVWLTTAAGEIVAGHLSCPSTTSSSCSSTGQWSWTVENVDPDGRVLNQGPLGISLGLHAIAVDAAGNGFAVGEHGLILERTGGGPQPWVRLHTGFLSNLWSVALPVGGGPGAIIGGEYGLILTYVNGRLGVAHQADPYDGVTASASTAASRVVGLALVPGSRSGEIEAWAAEQVPSEPGMGTGASADRNPGPSAILHYSSNLSDALLDAGVGRARPLPDTPAPEPGEISFAAFGKSDCQLTTRCPEPDGSNLFNNLIAERVASQIAGAAHAPGGPSFTLFTGDINDSGGGGGTKGSGQTLDLPLSQDVVGDNWRTLVADPIVAAGAPVFGAVGAGDLSRVQPCDASFTGQNCDQLLNIPWRQAFAGMPAPWGAPGNHAAPSSDGLSFEPVAATGVEGPAVSVCPTGATAGTVNLSEGTTGCSAPVGNVPSESVSTSGAHTHYAFDVVRGGTPVLRVVVVDTSLKTLSVSGGEQNPVEAQLKWMSDVLLGRPTAEQAIVVSETPSYTYGPGQNSDTLNDAAAFETLMRQDRVSAVVSGRLGWNGLYYTSTLVPDAHCPLAGGTYPDPSTGCSPTSPGGTGSAEQQAVGAAGSGLATLAGAIGTLGAPAPPPPDAALNAYPTVVAASAGGKFGPADQPSGGSADQGYWHGYTIVRLERSGSVVVEQRPVLDWIGISALTHELAPGQHMQLHGFGREPVGTDVPIQYDTINSPAITHRYDLVEADSDAPYEPATDPNGNYVPLDPSIATINRQTGFIQTGSGHHQRAYALAILSVGGKAATWPVVFEPSRSLSTPRPVLPQLPAIAPPSPVTPVHAAAFAAAVPPSSPAPPPTPPEVGTPSLPQLPTLTPPPPVVAVTPPAPPPPPPPPPPPSQPTPLPLALQAKLSPVGINATVVPPSPPPVNPAPPSGSAARKEAKQRQAATAKSEEGGGEQADAQARLDSANVPNQSFSRQTPGDGRHPFTAVRVEGQPSAWVLGLEYGGGIALLALLLAGGLSVAGPRSRRRTPIVAAPAWAPNRTDRQ